MPHPVRPLAAAAFAAAMVSFAAADDWPQWMGPNRDGVWKESGIVEKFPPGGPRKLWSVPAHGGYSGPAVAAGKVYHFDYELAEGDPVNNPGGKSELRGKERLLCLDAKSGQELWKFEYDCPYHVSYPAGPRCTPTVVGGKVYALGTMGHLHCLDAATGKVVWVKHFPKDYRAEVPMWGFCGHPLVHGRMLVCLVGGPNALLLAFDRDTGRELWRSLDTPGDGPGYCPPDVLDIGGAKQLVIWNPKEIVGLNPTDGKKLWAVPLKPSYAMSIMAPRQEGNVLFAGGIGNVAVAFRLDPGRLTPTELWRGKRNNAVYPVNATPLIDNGVIYGVDQPGELRAVKLATGERLWGTFLPVIGEEQDEGYTGAGSGTAFLVRNGSRYFLFAETGHLVIARLTPQKYEEIDRARLVEPTGEAFGRQVVWSHPAFAEKCVFVRNDKQIACYSLAAR